MISHISFRFISVLIWKTILVRFGVHFWALRDQQVVKMYSTIDAEIDIEKSRARGWPRQNETLQAVAQEGVKGDVNLPLGLGGLEKFGGMQIKNIRRKEEWRKDLHARLGVRRI